MLKVNLASVQKELPPPLISPGLSLQRQRYLFENIRDYCSETTKEQMCPMPTAPKPSQSAVNQQEQLENLICKHIDLSLN